MKPRALITGASAGLGAEFARQLAAKGYDLLLVARREDRLKAVAEEISAGHRVDAAIFCADLSDREAPKQIEGFVTTQSMQIDWLINNAGASGPDLLTNRDWEVQAKFHELMMTSVAQMCHRFIPPMQMRGFGRVINVSSFISRMARAGDANYGPTKSYVLALSEELALRLKSEGINVTALCPGFTDTDFHEVAGLMAMKRRLPSYLMYSAETVVREGIEAVERGRAIYASGRLFRVLDPLVQSVWTRPLFSRLAPKP